jgi:hypothetical protein
MEVMKHNLSGFQPEMRDYLMNVFGTYDENELKKIAEKSQKYDEMFQPKHSVNSRGAGRKAIFSQKDIDTINDMHISGKSIQEISVHFNTTRQTVSKYIAPGKRVRKNPFITMRMEYMYEKELCTSIDIDFLHKKIYIMNHTNDIIHRAFGIISNPTWEDFELFLERRCFPKTRANIKNILNDINVESYDPLQIIEKTEGRMAEDKQWIKITYPQRRARNGNN